MRNLVDPIHLWRISIYRNLSGEGGMHADNRWNTIGRPIVYLADSSAGALLEVLVHLSIELEEIPDLYTLLRIDVPAGLKVIDLHPAGEDWEVQEALTRQMGDTWLEAKESPLARVPSAIVPESWNYLLNPAHPDSKKIQISGATTKPHDVRLLRVRNR